MDKIIAKQMSNILKAYSDGKIIQKKIYSGFIDLNELTNQDIIDAVTSYNKKEEVLSLRIKSEKKLVPFTFEDNLLFKDKWIIDKEKKLPGVMKIISYNESNVHVEFGAIGYIHLLNKYCFEDGSPCGKYIEE